MVGDQVDERRRLHRDGVVAAVLVLRDAREPLEPLAAVDGEALDLRTELGTVSDEVLGGVAVGELGGATRGSAGPPTAPRRTTSPRRPASARARRWPGRCSTGPAAWGRGSRAGRWRSCGHLGASGAGGARRRSDGSVPGEPGRPPRGRLTTVAHPTTAVATLLGTAQQAAAVPHSWPEQYGRRIQFAGTCRDGDRVRVVEGGCADRSFLAVHERDGRPVAVLGVDQPRPFTRSRRQLRSAEPALP